MKSFLSFLFIIFFSTKSFASIEEKIIQNIKNIDNLNFDFEQNINGKIEKGKCVLEYPKKINCRYDTTNKKILVSNGKLIVIKTVNSYYVYPIEKTPLNFILSKDYILDRIKTKKKENINGKLIVYNFNENENEIKIFFDKENYNLVGWQTLDIYQNLSITYISSLIKNTRLKKNQFKIPEQH
tara:strand:+ start:485 stop:1033 length:549 start_codon:yes stop_codon:yes gene_type:complete